jgi:hypothetical protein
MPETHKITIRRECGFFSDFLTSLAGIMYCYDHDKDFHVDWNNTLYTNDINKNLFNEFFYQKNKTVSNFTVDYNNVTPYGFYFPKHVNFKTNKEFYDLYNKPSLLLKELNILNSDVINSIDKNFFNGEKVLGLHKRGTDHHRHGLILDNKIYTQKIDSELKNNNYDKIFLITDEIQSLNYFKEIYGDMIITTNSQKSYDENPLHYNNTSVLKEKLAEDVITDAILLSLCDFKIVTKSNVSTFSLLCNLDLYNFEYIDNGIQYS